MNFMLFLVVKLRLDQTPSGVSGIALFITIDKIFNKTKSVIYHLRIMLPEDFPDFSERFTT